MSVGTDQPFLQRLVSAEAFTAISHFVWSDVAMLWVDIGGGLLILGAVAAWVPKGVWAVVFATHDSAASRIVGPLVGPLAAIFTFVCSVGNVPLAAVLWNSGPRAGLL